METLTLDTAETVEAAPDTRGFRARILEELKFFGGLFAVMTVLFTFVFGHFKIPSESMQPALEVGDHLYVSKHPYGYSRHSLPFGLHHLPVGDWHVFARLPERGDVVVFRNPNTGIIMIKRAVGLPGDEVAMLNGRLIVNGKVIGRERGDSHLYRNHRQGVVVGVTEYGETLPDEDGAHTIWEAGDGGMFDTTEPEVVKPGHVFFMGDNRDASADSRDPSETGPGQVPVDHIIGRAEFMMFSFNRCADEDGLRCPGSRWMLRL